MASLLPCITDVPRYTGEQCKAYVDMSVMKHVGVSTTHECTIMVTIHKTIPKGHGNNETSSNTEIKCEIYYTSNLLKIVSVKTVSMIASPKANVHTGDHMFKYYLLCQRNITGLSSKSFIY